MKPDIPADPAQLVETYLRILMVPDPEGARRFVAPGVEIVFTGARPMREIAECAAFNAKRYRWVKKRFEHTHVVGAGTMAHAIVYNTGTLHGEWPDGAPFEGNRYVDRYTIRDGLIVRMEVWNDSGELLLQRAEESRDEAPVAVRPTMPRHGSGASPMRKLPHHERFSYSAITKRPDYTWPGGRRLAVYLGLNLEHFSFGEGLGAALGPPSPQPDVLNHSWREYGNRVGAWRMLELFEALKVPTGVILNTSMYDHAPELIEAFAKRGDEMIGHGHTNSERQGTMAKAEERELLADCRDRIAKHWGMAPRGWLSPWISESTVTPDLLAETGYRYTLNWCHDDQPTRFATRTGSLWSIPYPQELNDIPMIVARQMDARDFADMIVDHFDEMRTQSKGQPLVMGIALHAYLLGQPHRLRHLRRALEHIVGKDAWITTPGAILDHVESLPAGVIP